MGADHCLAFQSLCVFTWHVSLSRSILSTTNYFIFATGGGPQERSHA